MQQNLYNTDDNRKYAKTAFILMLVSTCITGLIGLIFIIVSIPLLISDDEYFKIIGITLLIVGIIYLLTTAYKIPMTLMARKRSKEATDAIALGVCTIVFFGDIIGIVAGIFLILIQKPNTIGVVNN